jgi:N-[(2S)-2-amino-2-carboxyethyl]-L-glutamate dehydrogenase
MFEFSVLSGATIKGLLDAAPASSIPSVQSAYLAHHDGQTVNPDSYFLRFPHNDSNRIIALPASLGIDDGVTGIKWIASFPGNVKAGLPRASAVVVLNDQQTGYPYALLEGSLISAARTAASAVLGAYWMNGCERAVRSISFVGAGIIARNIFDMFVADGWHFEDVALYDLDPASAEAFAGHVSGCDCGAATVTTLERALATDIVVFATTAGTPYVKAPHRFAAGQIVLNISLRDIGPELILEAENIFDDVDHCLKAGTSPHLAEQVSGNREFVSGTLAGLIRGEFSLDRNKALIFSPFGMGVLDLALGKTLFEQARSQQQLTMIPDFFAETTRW